jgi:hypothetical protein
VKLTYEEFLRAKLEFAPSTGFEVAPEGINPLCKPHQRDIIQWKIRGGRRANFSAFGTGKTIMQQEPARIIQRASDCRYLQVIRLANRADFVREASLDTPEWRSAADAAGLDYDRIVRDYGIEYRWVQSTAEVGGPGIYLTNYESVRECKLDANLFDAAGFDEASILRGFGGTKTFRELMRIFEGTVKYRFVDTAMPSPNDFIELLAYSAFLGIMDVSQAKTRFFKRNSEKADELVLHPHKEREFWMWVSSWAVYLQRPSDLGYSDEGYELPDLDVHWHEIPTGSRDAGAEPSGQGRLIPNANLGVVEASREKRESLPGRIEKMMELRALDPEAHRIIWHDLEAEREAIENALDSDSWASVWGTMKSLEERETLLREFADGEIQELATKPVIAGSGCNFQRHCSWEIFLGIGFKFHDFIQAIHRVYRFLQMRRVRIDLIYTEAEREIRRDLERKWDQHKELTAQMSAIIRKYGLATTALRGALARALGVDRDVASGEGWEMVLNDCVPETALRPADSAHLILTSIPFSTQYEYSPNYADFGHTDSNEHFWEQMDYLIPELLRVLQPGRVAAIHVKDRIVPSGLTGMGFQTVYPFSDACIAAFRRHGFGFLARKTIVTDVVRENNQTYRLGWTEQCKDGSRMGAGMPEYLLLFRKPPTDTSNGYADYPVVKEKAKYSRSRWQIDAHGFMRSSGDRLLSTEDLIGVKHDTIFKLFRKYSETSVYDYEHHVALSESLERCRNCGHVHAGDKRCHECDCRRDGSLLPRNFMLLQPQSWHDDVWTDVARMRTLNGAQEAAGREMHLCPLQFDIADRVIRQFTMEGELVYDPFAGLGTVPLRAVLMGRRGFGVELSAAYWRDAVRYLTVAAVQSKAPTLFDLIEAAEDSSPQMAPVFDSASVQSTVKATRPCW